MRLIDADELIKQACRSTEWSHGEHPMVIEADDIDDAPTVDAEPVKHAHWIEFRTNSGNVHYKCSHCGKDVSYPYAKKRWKYCIECGARMDDREGESKS